MLLRVDDLNVFYGAAHALRGVSIQARKGQIVGILGTNGAGKSTTLKAVSGVVTPRSGQIRFDGTDTTRLSTAELLHRGVVHVPEGRRLFPEMSVRDNLLAGAFSKTAWRRRTVGLKEAYERFPRLYERQSQMAGSLSGGEQQMVAIARGLMTQPRLLLLDEPTLGLAPIIVDAIFEMIRGVRDAGCTVLIVEQNTRAIELTDYVYVIQNGTISHQGPKEEFVGHSKLRGAYLGLDEEAE